MHPAEDASLAYPLLWLCQTESSNQRGPIWTWREQSGRGNITAVLVTVPTDKPERMVSWMTPFARVKAGINSLTPERSEARAPLYGPTLP